MKVTKHTSEIWTIKDFLSKEECDELIRQSEEIGYQEADISYKAGSKMVKSIRDNYRVTLESEELANEYWEKVKEFCPETIDDFSAQRLNERFRFYRYSDEQRFRRHRDGRVEISPTEESRITMMIYLNDGFEGGETSFKNVKIQPEPGTVLLFIHEEKHEGLPVTNGVKYVLRTDVIYNKQKE